MKMPTFQWWCNDCDKWRNRREVNVCKNTICKLEGFKSDYLIIHRSMKRKIKRILNKGRKGPRMDIKTRRLIRDYF